jgi:hypothetical protein
VGRPDIDSVVSLPLSILALDHRASSPLSPFTLLAPRSSLITPIVQPYLPTSPTLPNTPIDSLSARKPLAHTLAPRRWPSSLSISRSNSSRRPAGTSAYFRNHSIVQQRPHRKLVEALEEIKEALPVEKVKRKVEKKREIGRDPQVGAYLLPLI